MKLTLSDALRIVNKDEEFSQAFFTDTESFRVAFNLTNEQIAELKKVKASIDNLKEVSGEEEKAY